MTLCVQIYKMFHDRLLFTKHEDLRRIDAAFTASNLNLFISSNLQTIAGVFEAGEPLTFECWTTLNSAQGATRHPIIHQRHSSHPNTLPQLFLQEKHALNVCFVTSS